MKTKLGVLDYGCGNLHSVARACSKFAGKVEIIERYASDTSFTHLVLPGVGSYSNTVQEIRTRGLESFVIEKINDGIPVLGICVGMQILTTIGYENAVSQGLDVIKGSTEILSLGKYERNFRIPHMGWNRVVPLNVLKGNYLFKNLENGFDAYFAHSYEIKLKHSKDICAVSEYSGRNLVAAVNKGSVYGVQFHPEKSGEAGLRILSNFIATK